MEWITDPQAWIALATLTALEIVLGIDNLVFVSVLTGRLPAHRRSRARRVGLLLAMVMRIALLLALSWVIGLVAPLLTVFHRELSARDLILMAGGAFLIAKATLEIHHALEGAADRPSPETAAVTFGGVLIQIALIDIVFSLDSVITAVGMCQHVAVMVLAVVASIVVMALFVNAICDFVEHHPTFKMLALSFLLLIGVALVGEGWDLHIPKGYIYSAMGFSLLVELLNLRLRPSAQPPVKLRGPSSD